MGKIAAAPLNNPRHEAFAAALARGASVREATAEADLSRRHLARMIALALTEPIADRVAELRREAVWNGSLELAAVYDEMMRLARAAGRLKTGAGMLAAGKFLAEAARLCERATKAASEGGARLAGPIMPPVLTKEEWLAAFVPKT